MRDQAFDPVGDLWSQSASVSANSFTVAVHPAVSTIVLRLFDAILVPTVILGKAGGREPDGDPMTGNAIHFIIEFV